MTVAIFVWKPNWSDGSDGHASTFNHSYEPHKKTYISWWPKGQVGYDGKAPACGTGGSPKRTFKEDREGEGDGKPRNPDWSLTPTGLHEGKIRRYWDRLHAHRYEWDYYKFNCSSVVYHALRAGGAEATMSDPIRPMNLVGYCEALRRTLDRSRETGG